MRIPTLHIREDVLAHILEVKLGIKNSKKVAEDILASSKQYALTNRRITITNEKLFEKVKRINTASRDITSDFIRILYYVRKQENSFIKVTIPKPGSRDYNMAKEIALDAHNFCEQFSLPRDEGFVIYVELGLAKVKKFAYYKFKNLYEGICDTYRATKVMNDNPDPERVLKIYQYYTQQVVERTGLALFNYKDNPEKYQYFVLVLKECTRTGVPIKMYIDAQFDAFEFRGRYPEPEQLIGDKALARVQRYLAENNIKISNGKNRANNKQ